MMFSISRTFAETYPVCDSAAHPRTVEVAVPRTGMMSSLRIGAGSGAGSNEEFR
jgi:hypothetical protein